MQSDSRSSSTASPPPIEASEESDFYAQPNDSTTSVMVDDCAKAAEEGTVVSAEPSAASAYAELDFDRTKIHRLPNELLMYIFGKFDSPTDVFVCMLVCKRWARHSVDLLWHRPACTSGPNLYSISEVLAKDRPFFSYRLFVRRLNLSGLSAVVDDSHLEPLAVCSRLERLTLSNCNLITDLSLAKMVSNAPSLLALDASQVTKITGESINKLAENCPRLQGLNITNCLNVSNASLINLAEHCRYIKRLKLNGCLQVSNPTVTAFAEKCPNMVEIDLMNCTQVGNAPVAALLAHGQALRELRLSGCEQITDDAFLNLPPLKVFNHLRILDLTSCTMLTDLAVQKIISAAPRLRNLVLNKCRSLTDGAVYAISRLGKNLHYLHLGHCSNITDEGVKKLVQECTRIRYIDLGCCAHLTDDSIIQLASLPKLKRIGLVKCLKITDECVKALARRKTRDQFVTSSSLERVHLSYCTALNLESIFILLNSCPKLTHLSLTGVQAFQNSNFTEFCRQPPPEFTVHQREMFCVFSGNGVVRFREYLNRTPEYAYLREAWRQYLAAQQPLMWPGDAQYNLAHHAVNPVASHLVGRPPPFGSYAPHQTLGPHAMLAHRAGPHYLAPLTHDHRPNHHLQELYYTAQAPGPLNMPPHGSVFAQGHGDMFVHQPGVPWRSPWDASGVNVQNGAAARAYPEVDLTGMNGDMSSNPAFRRPRASTATGVVRWPEGGALDAGDGSSSGEQTVVGAPAAPAGPATAPTAVPAAAQTANEDADAEDEDDDMRGGAHL